MSDKKRTLVVGASPNPARYSYLATQMLQSFGHEVIAFGKRKGSIGDTVIENEFPTGQQFDTVTLYLNAENQIEYYDDIVALKPKRVIFNPGTENDAFYALLQDAAIEYEEACTLVLLKTGRY